jgi:alpha-mannosidase
MKPTLHLIANAHLDPVWLWDRAEGMAEALATMRSIVRLMHERPEMTFIRGESLIYEEVRRHDPETFAAVVELVESGRWDVVGGNYLQPDMNLPASDTLRRIFSEGQAFFKTHFGKPVRAGWSADCFGHSAGLPDILAVAGLKYYAFGRPAEGGGACGMPQENVFWWHGPSGGRVLAHRTNTHWYGCERGELPKRLDETLAWSLKAGRAHAAVFFGLGNHGGGPSARQLDDIETWSAAHPECKVVYSGLHRFFGSLEKEIRAGRLHAPEFRGELNFALRGVNSTGAKFKFAYRRAEAAMVRAERAVNDAGLAKRLPGDLWRKLLFNAFHDILPATCTEAALDQQTDEVRGICHTALEHEREALIAMAAKLRPTVPPAPAPDHPQAVPFMVWNPLDRPWKGLVEIETGLDYRPLFGTREPDVRVLGVDGKAVSYQSITVGHNFMPGLVWRHRVLIPVSLPARGAGAVSIGWVPGHRPPAFPKSRVPASATGSSRIRNGWFYVEATKGGIQCKRGEKSTSWLRFPHLLTVEDPWGPWGGHYDEPDARSLNSVRHKWSVTGWEVLESGPWRSVLRIRLAAGRSDAELDFQLEAGRRAIAVSARIFWNEENARLKLVFPVGAKNIELQVPGGTTLRGESGEGPGGRWLRALGGKLPFALTTDSLYDFSLYRGAVQSTIVRSSRYTQSEPLTHPSGVRGPVIDRGEYRFRLVLTDAPESIAELAEELEFPAAYQMTFSH